MNRERALVGAAILGLAILSWVIVVSNMGPVMGMPSLPIDYAALGVFVLAWTVGMVAMMFPTAVPMLMMFFHVGKAASKEVQEGGGPTPVKAFLFIGTYIAFWAATGAAFYLSLAYIFSLISSDASLFITSPLGLGLGLILVAAYQLSPIKGECLSRCHPSSFLFGHYSGGLSGSVRMGVDYAKYCIGCCWVLMAFLMVSASMGVAWMAGFAAIIFIERTFPIRKWMPRLFGVGFLVVGAALVVVG